MNVVYIVYVVYVVGTGFTQLSQEKQALKPHGNPPIPLLRSRYQRSQRTQRSFLNPPSEPLWRMAVGPTALRASRDRETRNRPGAAGNAVDQNRLNLAERGRPAYTGVGIGESKRKSRFRA